MLFELIKGHLSLAHKSSAAPYYLWELKTPGLAVASVTLLPSP